MTLHTSPLADSPPFFAEPARVLPGSAAKRPRNDGFEMLGGWWWLRANLAMPTEASDDERNAWLLRQRKLEAAESKGKRRGLPWSAWLLAWLAVPFAAVATPRLSPVVYVHGFSYRFNSWLTDLVEWLLLVGSALLTLQIAALVGSTMAGFAARRALEADPATADLLLAGGPKNEAAHALHFRVARATSRLCAFAGACLFAGYCWAMFIIGSAWRPAEAASTIFATTFFAILLSPTWAAGCFRRASSAALLDIHETRLEWAFRDAFWSACCFAARWGFYFWLAYLFMGAFIEPWSYFPDPSREFLFVVLAFAVIGERRCGRFRMKRAAALWRAASPHLAREMEIRLAEDDRSE